MTQELTTVNDLPLAPAEQLEQCVQDAQDLAQDAMAPATRRAYAADWDRFGRWCQGHQLEALGPPGQIALYLAHRVRGGASVAVLSRALAAIAKAYEIGGLANPRRDPAVALVYSGARRRLGVAPEQVEAILPSQLHKMVDDLTASEGPGRLRDLRNRALLTLGWEGGFRRAPLLALDVADLQDVPEGLRVTIRRDKTDQEGKGRVIGIPYQSSYACCAVRAVREWLAAAGIEQGAIFRTISPDGQDVLSSRLTDRQLANIVARAARRAGLKGRYAGHSLRAGFVTSAVRAGKPVKAIMAQTGHRTFEMLLRYVREQELFTDNAAAGLL